jgi:DNA-binding GntR family transcriptional regulator
MIRVRDGSPDARSALGSRGNAEEPEQIEMSAPKGRKRPLAGRARSAASKTDSAQGTNSSLTLKAYEELKERIIVGYFLAGQYLKEGDISSQLGLGRTPVHQALQRLHVEGLVEVVPRKGVIIQPDSIRQIMEILDARFIIESELAAGAAENGSKEEASELERILSGQDAPSGARAIDAFIEVDRAFHARIATMSRNKILGDFAKSLHERSIRYWYLQMWQTMDTVSTQREHRAILDAIRKGDRKAASRAMRAHIKSLRDRLAEIQSHGPRRHISLAQR